MLRRLDAMVIEDACVIGGRYDGVEYDDVEQVFIDVFGDVVDPGGLPFRSSGAGERLSVIDEAGLWGELVLEEADGPFPYYNLDLPDGPRRDAVGALSIDVPGGNGFPGIGPVALPAVETLEAEPLETDGAGRAPIEAMARWTPGSGDRGVMFFEYEIYDEAGELAIECVTADDGDFTLPDATLARLPDTLRSLDGLYLSRERQDLRLAGDVLVQSVSDSWAVLFRSDFY